MDKRVNERSGHLLSFAREGDSPTEVYRTSGCDGAAFDNPCREHSRLVTLSIPLTGRVYRSGCEVVIRGPGCTAFDLPLLRGRDTLHLVFPLLTLARAARGQTASSFRTVLPGPRSCDDPFVVGLALALITLLDTVGSGAPQIESFMGAFAAHVALEYGSFARPATSARLTTDQTISAQRLLERDPNARPDIGRIAAAFRLSLSGFERAYKRATGVTPYAWLMSRRAAARRRSTVRQTFGNGKRASSRSSDTSDLFRAPPNISDIRLCTNIPEADLLAAKRFDVQ
jgi:AraC-like DNA-binding protein